MRVMNLSTDERKRVRGLGRKTADMVAGIRRGCSSFPAGEEEEGWGFWHLHLPIRQDFIDSRKTPFGVRRLCAQTLIDCAASLSAQKPPAFGDSRVLAFINLPGLWYSEIVVFFDEGQYRDFFFRDNEYQTWVELPSSRSIVREWNLALPPGFSARGYREILRNEGEEYENELWYLGELT
jgi:hypothetical protein